jgi:hypothetical protein
VNELQNDVNLLIVTAVEGYSAKHNLPTDVALKRLRDAKAISAIRRNYESLHTQSIYESIDFVDDFVNRNFA